MANVNLVHSAQLDTSCRWGRWLTLKRENKRIASSLNIISLHSGAKNRYSVEYIVKSSVLCGKQFAYNIPMFSKRLGLRD